MFQQTTILQTPHDLAPSRDAGSKIFPSASLPERNNGSCDPLSQERAHIYECPVTSYRTFLQKCGIITDNQIASKVSHGQKLFDAEFNGRMMPAHLFSAMANPYSSDDPLLLRTVEFLSEFEDRFLLLHPLPTFRIGMDPNTCRMKILIFAGWLCEMGMAIPICINQAGFVPLANFAQETDVSTWCDRKILGEMEDLNQAIISTHLSKEEINRPVTLSSPYGWNFFASTRVCISPLSS